MRSAKLSSVWGEVHAFVRAECAGRSSGHGAPHAQAIAESALLVANMEGHGTNEPLLTRVLVLGLLHDVADHKFDDAAGSMIARVQKFVLGGAERWFGDAAEGPLCLSAIDAVSFSKENKRGMRWFEPALGGVGAQWVTVRDIVSDADKLAAIGVEGILRCWQYGRETKASMTPQELAKRVQDHADEKLLLLKDKFIVTPSGKALAEPRHQDMLDILALWAKEAPTTYDAPLHV
jgi:hypothetical protein